MNKKAKGVQIAPDIQNQLTKSLTINAASQTHNSYSRSTNIATQTPNFDTLTINAATQTHHFDTTLNTQTHKDDTRQGKPQTLKPKDGAVTQAIVEHTHKDNSITNAHDTQTPPNTETQTTNTKTDKRDIVIQTENKIVNTNNTTTKKRNVFTSVGNFIFQAKNNIIKKENVTTETGNQTIQSGNNIILIGVKSIESGNKVNSRENIFEQRDNTVIQINNASDSTANDNHKGILTGKGNIKDLKKTLVKYASDIVEDEIDEDRSNDEDKTEFNLLLEALEESIARSERVISEEKDDDDSDEDEINDDLCDENTYVEADSIKEFVVGENIH